MLYICFAILYIVYLFRNHLNKYTKVALTLLPFLIIIWTRYGLGADYFSYEDIYTSLNIDAFSTLFNSYKDIDLGFKILMCPFRILNVPFHVFISIINSVVLFVFAKWVSDNSEEYEMSMLLFYAMFFFVWILSAVRQSIVLSFGLYFMFNKKRDISIKQIVVLVFVLSLFHSSALFLLVFYLLSKVNWNRKLHSIFLAIALVTSFLPVDKILEVFTFIPGVSRVLGYYTSNNYVFYDFPGLIRLLIFAGVFVFYDKLSNEKKETDMLLYGVSIYFLLKFSEITASRATIFSYVLIILLIPQILKGIKYEIVLVPILVFGGSFVYFQKEFTTMFSQASLIGDVTWNTYPNIFNREDYEFSTRSYYTSSIREQANQSKESYDERFESRKELDFDSNSKYYSVRNKKYFAIIDNHGNWLNKPNYKYDVSVYDGIFVEKYYAKEKFFADTKLTDLTSQGRSYDEMLESLVERDVKNKYTGITEERVSKDDNVIPDSIKQFYPDETGISRIVLNKFYEPFEYYIMRVDYQEMATFVYLDKDMKPLVPFPLRYATRYNLDGFLYVDSGFGWIVVNDSGEIIWWE